MKSDNNERRQSNNESNVDNEMFHIQEKQMTSKIEARIAFILFDLLMLVVVIVQQHQTLDTCECYQSVLLLHH